jgi:hypothetical protein
LNALRAAQSLSWSAHCALKIHMAGAALFKSLAAYMIK